MAGFFGRHAYSLLRRLGALDQRLCGFLGFGPLHVGQHDCDNQEPDQGEPRDDQQADAHFFVPRRQLNMTLRQAA